MTELGQFDVRYTGVEANEILLEPVFMDDDIKSSYRLMPNVVTKKKLQFAKALEKIVRKYTGCGFTPIGKFEVYDREVSVEKMKIDLKLCIDEFLDTVFEELLRRGTRIQDLTSTVIEQIFIERIRQALKLDIDRIVHFSNLANSDPNYDQMSGFWTVHYPDLVAGNFIPYMNTGSGAALNPGDGFDIIRSIYDNSPLQLRGLPTNMKQFNVSGSVYNQFREDVENGGGGDFGLISMLNGIERLTFRGIEIKPQWRWDEIMSVDFASPNSHLCELTTPMNKVLATDIVNPGEDFMIWYDEKEEHLFVKSRWKMDANYIHHSLISVGY